jgi:hypothetical protein
MAKGHYRLMALCAHRLQATSFRRESCLYMFKPGQWPGVFLVSLLAFRDGLTAIFFLKALIQIGLMVEL